MNGYYQGAAGQAPAGGFLPVSERDTQSAWQANAARGPGDQSPPNSPLLSRVVERVAMANDELRSLASMIGAFANRVMGSVPTTDGLTGGKTQPPRMDCAASTLSELQDEQQRLINQIRAEAFRLDGIA